MRCYAFAPPAVLSLDLARAASHVTSVVLGPDVVPRFGMATTMDLRESLAVLHHEPVIMAEIARRRAMQMMMKAGEAMGPGGTSDQAEWATTQLTWLKSQLPVRSKLFPGGRIVWTPTELPAAVGGPAVQPRPAPLPTREADFVVVDQTAFATLVLCGSQMFTAHMPQSYAHFLLGSVRAVN